MYTRRGYDQMSKLAEEIRLGQYKQEEETPEVKPLVQPKEKPKERFSSENVSTIMAQYMASFREQEIAPEPKAKPKENKTPASGSLISAKRAIAAIESQGSGGYSALGPIMEKGFYKGDRAYGKYQVMGKNIPSWTKEALGESMTPEQFLKDPRAQEKVASHFLQKAYDQHGTWEDAASVWFSGQPLSVAKNRDDGYISVDQYVKKFRRNLS